jgi:hypothetical protein
MLPPRCILFNYSLKSVKSALLDSSSLIIEWSWRVRVARIKRSNTGHDGADGEMRIGEPGWSVWLLRNMEIKKEGKDVGKYRLCFGIKG